MKHTRRTHRHGLVISLPRILAVVLCLGFGAAGVLLPRLNHPLIHADTSRLIGHTDVDGVGQEQVSPGQTVTFHHSITVTPGSSVSFYYGIRYTLNNQPNSYPASSPPYACAWPDQTNPPGGDPPSFDMVRYYSSRCEQYSNDSATVTGGQTLSGSKNMTAGLTIPSNAQNGDFFCEWIAFSTGANQNGYGSPACVDVVVQSSPPPITCTAIANGQKCSDGSIRCNSGYVQSGSKCVSQSPPPSGGGSGGGGGGSGGGTGGGSTGGGGGSTGGSGSGGGGGSSPIQGSGGSGVQGGNSPDSSSPVPLQDDSGTTNQDSSDGSIDYSDGTTSGSSNNAQGTGTSNEATIQPAGHKGTAGIAWLVLLFLIILGAAGFFIWRRQRAGDDELAWSDLPLPAAIPQAPSAPVTSLYEEKINEAFYPASRTTQATAKSHTDEPPDMFEMAREHPETYGILPAAPASPTAAAPAPPVAPPVILPSADLLPPAAAQVQPAAVPPATHEPKPAKRGPHKPATPDDDNGTMLVIPHNK